MEDKAKQLHFFLGANTPQGFVSRFDQLADPSDGWREFVLKGGPGTGKSSLMKKIAAYAGARGARLELIHCSSDVDSLDGVILPEIKASIADGTAPHAIEPKYPGAFEQLIDLSGCWDGQLLYESREEIMRLSAKISRCHEYSCRFLSAASSLLGDTYRIALDATDTAKAAKAAGRIADTELGRGGAGRGRESARFLSAVCNKGVRLFSETALALCDRVYLIEDSFGASSRLILSLLRSRALEAGYDVYACCCPLSPFEKLEHLFIPALRLGFMTKNDYLSPEVPAFKVVRARRFTDQDAIKKSRKRISFNKKAAAQMLEQAARLIAEAKMLHDKLEACYTAAVDFSKVDAVCAATLARYEQLLSSAFAVCF